MLGFNVVKEIYFCLKLGIVKLLLFSQSAIKKLLTMNHDISMSVFGDKPFPRFWGSQDRARVLYLLAPEYRDSDTHIIYLSKKRKNENRPKIHGM